MVGLKVFEDMKEEKFSKKPTELAGKCSSLFEFDFEFSHDDDSI